MKQYWMLGAVLALVLGLTACGGGETAPSQPETPPPAEEPAAQPEEHPQPETPAPPEAPTPATVTVDYAPEDLLAQTDAYDTFIDDDSEYQVLALFTPSGTVEQFRYVELAFAEQDGEIVFEVARDLYTADTLSPDRPLVIGLALTGAIPDRGIVYDDGTGAVRTYTLSMSGKDASLLLTEIP